MLPGYPVLRLTCVPRARGAAQGRELPPPLALLPPGPMPRVIATLPRPAALRHLRGATDAERGCTACAAFIGVCANIAGDFYTRGLPSLSVLHGGTALRASRAAAQVRGGTQPSSAPCPESGEKSQSDGGRPAATEPIAAI